MSTGLNHLRMKITVGALVVLGAMIMWVLATSIPGP